MKEKTNPVMMDMDSGFRYSVLCVSNHNFVIEISNIREVAPLPKITKVPNVNESFIGVFNLRGEIYSILDLRALLGLETVALTEDSMVAIIEHESVAFGVIVDKVIGVMAIDESKIEIPTREMSPRFIQYLSGFYNQENLGIVHMLDISELLKAPEIQRYTQ